MQIAELYKFKLRHLPDTFYRNCLSCTVPVSHCNPSTFYTGHRPLEMGRVGLKILATFMVKEKKMLGLILFSTILYF